MKRSIPLSCLWLLLGIASLQAQDVPTDYSLDTPYDTIVTHLGCLQKGNYHPEIAAKAFSPKGRTAHKSIKLAIKLKELLEKEGIDINMEEVPKDAQYIDPEAKYHRYQLAKKFPQIYLIKLQGKWLYSEETAHSIDQLLQENYPLGIKRPQDIFPQSFHKQLFGIQIWQYLIIALLIPLLSIGYAIILFIVSRLIRRFSHHWTFHYVMLTGKSISRIAIALLMTLLLPAIQLPASIEKSILLLFRGLIALSLTAICYRSISVSVINVYKRFTGEDRRGGQQLVPLLQTFLKVVVAIVGTLFILRSLGFDISTLLAGVSIGSIAFALASQDTIKHLFGSLMILIDRPFSVGDAIVAGGVEGEVEEIGMRSTRIRTSRESIISVPNAKLADKSIDNYGLRKHRRFYMHLQVPYDIPTASVETFVEELRKVVVEHPHIWQDKHFVYLAGARDANMEIIFYIYLDAANWSQELQCRQDILLKIINIAKNMDIPLSFSTHTSRMEDF